MKELERLERMLAERGGMAKVELREQGSRSRLLSLARNYSQRKYGKGRGTILTGEETSEPGFRRVKTQRSWVEIAGGFDVCALLLPSFCPQDPPYEREFARDMAILCAERDWLLLLDESATALGKTGCLFGYQHLGLLPDGAFFEEGILVGDKLAGVANGLTNSWGDPISPQRCLTLLAGVIEGYPQG